MLDSGSHIMRMRKTTCVRTAASVSKMDLWSIVMENLATSLRALSKNSINLMEVANALEKCANKGNLAMIYTNLMG